MSTSGKNGSSHREGSTNRAPDLGYSKVAKPDFFYGDRNKLDDWLNQVMLFLRQERIQPEQKTFTAVSYLRGEAQQWIRPRLNDALEHKKDTGGMFSDFDNFLSEIRGIYGLSNDKQVAIRIVQQLTQKTSASTYTAKFKEYAVKTGWNDQALVSMYYRGLIPCSCHFRQWCSVRQCLWIPQRFLPRHTY